MNEEGEILANPRHDRHPPLSDDVREARLDDWLEMAAAGFTLEQMGRKYGVTRQRVAQILHGAGVNLHDAKAARRVAAKQAYDNTQVSCPFCGGTYLQKDKSHHFRGGTHKFKRFQSRRPAAEVARDSEITSRYEQGQKVLSIAKEFNIALPMVYRALRWNGVEPHRRATARHRTREGSAQLKQWIIEVWRADTLLIQEIAEKFGVSDGWVAMILKGSGLGQTRTEAQRRKHKVMQKRARERTR